MTIAPFSYDITIRLAVIFSAGVLMGSLWIWNPFVLGVSSLLVSIVTCIVMLSGGDLLYVASTLQSWHQTKELLYWLTGLTIWVAPPFAAGTFAGWGLKKWLRRL